MTYFIGVINIHDHKRYSAEVVGKGQQSVAAHHGRIHLIGDVTDMTKDSPTANRIIIVEFPNSAAPRAWRDSAEAKQLLDLVERYADLSDYTVEPMQQSATTAAE